MNKSEDTQAVLGAVTDEVTDQVTSSQSDASKTAAIESGQLGRARAQLGLSLADLSAETRIPKRHLAALENHQVDRLPAKLFVIGYLRTCAEFLGLELDMLLAEYGVAETVVRDATANTSAADTVLAGDTAHSVLSAGPGMAVRSSIWRMTAMAVLPLLFIILFAWAYSMQDEAVAQPTVIEVLPTAEALSAPLGQLAPVALSQQSIELKTTEAAEGGEAPLKQVINSNDITNAVAVIDEPQAATTNENTATDPSVSSGSAVDVMLTQHQSQDRLVIEVSEDSWVHITDAAGSQLFRDLARAGKKIDVSGDLPFNLHLGNAPGLALELNGSPFAITDYRDDNSARFVMSRR